MKVKKKHLVGRIKDFPKYIVQLMVDEQVKQGNEADPSVFAKHNYSDKNSGGFNWHDAELGFDVWDSVIVCRKFDAIPKPKGHVHAKAIKKYAKDSKTSETPWENWEFQVAGDAKWYSLGTHPNWCVTSQYRRKSNNLVEPETNSKVQPTPNEIVRAMLAKGMTVWAVVSDMSYDLARENLNKYVHHITGYVEGRKYPMTTAKGDWKYAVPVDTATMTEITEMP